MADPVYLTINEFPGTGAPAPTVVDFAFAGGYISPAHVKAELFDPVTYLRTPVTVTDEHFVTDYRLSLPVSVPVGSVLRVYRDTPKDQPLVNFTNGARIAENNLDLVAEQSVFVAAESADQIASTQIANVLQAADASATNAVAAQEAAAASAASAALSEEAAQDGASSAGAFALAASNSAAAASDSAAAAAASAQDAAEEVTVVRTDLASVGSGKGAEMVAFQRATTGASTRTVAARLADTIHDADFSTTAGLLAAGAGKTVLTLSPAAAPVAVAGANILWDFLNGGNADTVLQSNGSRGGLFADYDCKAARVMVEQINEDQTAISGGGFRDLLFLNVVDGDTADYTAIGQKVTNGIRSFVIGANNGTAFQAQYKDLVGSYFAAVGNIQWAARGVSAITADAYQFGIGIASNEFVVHNPSAANGSVGHSTSMAAVQAIVRSRYADEDATHFSRGVYVENNGLRITAGVEIISNTSEGFTSRYKFGLKLDGATVSDAAIVMPQSVSGSAGTIIQYDPNDYSVFYRSTNQFAFVAGAAVKLATNANGITVGGDNNSTKTRIYIEPSTTGVSHMQLYPGATPASPNNGELWFDGTAVKIVVGGVVKTFTLT